MPATPTPKPIPVPRGATTAPGGLKDVLEKLAAALANLNGAGLPGGTTAAGLPAPGAAASLGLAPFQALAAQIARTTAGTGQAFATSLGQAQRTWQAATARAAQGWASGAASYQAKFGQANGRVAAGFERAFDTSIGRVIHGVGRASGAVAKVAQQAWAQPIGYPVGVGRSAWGFAHNFASGWKYAAPGGLPMPGVGTAWGQNAHLWAQATAHGAWAKVRRRMRGGVIAFRRGFGSVARGFKHRGRRARSQFSQTFWRTGSLGKAAKAGATGFVGKAGMAGMTRIAGLAGGAMIPRLGELLLVVTAVTAAMKTLQAGFEQQNASNRHLGAYNGHIAGAFNRLAIGDIHRNVDLARSLEGSATTLAGLTNKSRDIQNNFDKLSGGINNRVASAGAVVWNNVAKPYSDAAGWLSGHMERFDPGGNTLAAFADTPFALLAGAGSAIKSILTGGNLKDALDEAQRDFAQHQVDAIQAAKSQLDPWSATLKVAMNQGPIRAARPIKL